MSGQLAAHRIAMPATSTEPAERLAAMFDLHYERLYRLARRLTASTDDALDLVQEAFLRAARCVKSVPVGDAAEQAWLVRVLINIRRDQWRQSSSRKRHDLALQGGYSALEGGSDPETSLIARSAVWRALEGLPPRRRAIIVMHEIEGLALPAIAVLLGISVITARWHLSVGKRDLKRVLRTQLGGTK
jgi:RNA polymerase sigma-70 factor (ECF subfamily)